MEKLDITQYVAGFPCVFRDVISVPMDTPGWGTVRSETVCYNVGDDELVGIFHGDVEGDDEVAVIKESFELRDVSFMVRLRHEVTENIYVPSRQWIDTTTDNEEWSSPIGSILLGMSWSRKGRWVLS
jgi:hypothetical protein